MKKIRFTIELDFAEGACAQRIHDDVNVHLTEDLHDLLRSYGHDPRSPATMDDLYGALTTEEVDEDGDDAGDYADHEVAITYPATCGPTPHTIVTSNRRHFRKHCSDMTDEVWTCVQQALSSGLRPIMADTDGGRVGPVSFKPLQKGGSVVRIHDRHAGHDGVLIYTAVTVGDCLCDISRIAYIAALEQGVTATVGCVIAEPVRRGQGGAA
jgi:hypothetical protein